MMSLRRKTMIKWMLRMTTKLSTKLPWHKRQRIHMLRVSGTVRKGSKTTIYRHHFLFRCSLFTYKNRYITINISVFGYDGWSKGRVANFNWLQLSYKWSLHTQVCGEGSGPKLQYLDCTSPNTTMFYFQDQDDQPQCSPLHRLHHSHPIIINPLILIQRLLAAAGGGSLQPFSIKYTDTRTVIKDFSWNCN